MHSIQPPGGSVDSQRRFGIVPEVQLFLVYGLKYGCRRWFVGELQSLDTLQRGFIAFRQTAGPDRYAGRSVGGGHSSPPTGRFASRWSGERSGRIPAEPYPLAAEVIIGKAVGRSRGKKGFGQPVYDTGDNDL